MLKKKLSCICCCSRNRFQSKYKKTTFTSNSSQSKYNKTTFNPSSPHALPIWHNWSIIHWFQPRSECHFPQEITPYQIMQWNNLQTTNISSQSHTPPLIPLFNELPPTAHLEIPTNSPPSDPQAFFNGIKSSRHPLHTFNQKKTKNLILLLQNYLQWPQPIQPRNEPCADKYIQWVKDFNLRIFRRPTSYL